MSILITGGAGYVGSHTAKHFADGGHDVVVLDNLSTGRRECAQWGTFVEGDITDRALVCRVIEEHAVDAVVHLAADTYVSESMLQPEKYFANNVTASLALLDAMVATGVQQLVFASSCSVYGETAADKVKENEAVAPVSPYGESKLAIERVLPWYERAHGLRWIALRYFNAAGGEGELAEVPELSQRIIPRALYAALTNGHPLTIYGTDFPTPDGSAVRDYVHVSDIARANLLALQYVHDGQPGAVVNIGAGVGVSVSQIVEEIGRQSGHAVPFHVQPARDGDPAHVTSDPSHARRLLGWSPQVSTLSEMVSSLLQAYGSRTIAT